jgi:hypothetical protein
MEFLSSAKNKNRNKKKIDARFFEVEVKKKRVSLFILHVSQNISRLRLRNKKWVMITSVLGALVKEPKEKNFTLKTSPFILLKL